jgi:hypothetical protein
MLIRNDAAGYRNFADPPAASASAFRRHTAAHPAGARRAPCRFHPASLHLFTKNLAVLVNVGMIVQPSAKPALETGGAPRPANLFSHSDQEIAVQSGAYTGLERIGWGGRVADRLDAANPGTLFPPLISVHGLRTFVNGRTSVPLAVPSNPNFQLLYSGEGYYQYDVLRDAAVREILGQVYANNVYAAAARSYTRRRACRHRPSWRRFCKTRHQWSSRCSRASIPTSADS